MCVMLDSVSGFSELTSIFQGTTQGICKIQNLKAPHFAEVSPGKWTDPYPCGKCISVKCRGPECKSSQTMIAQVVDQCKNYEREIIDISSGIFNAFNGNSARRSNVDWEYVPCPNGYFNAAEEFYF